MKLDVNDRYEIAAMLFQQETGFMAPGKDQSPAFSCVYYESREAAWLVWGSSKRALVEKVLDIVEEYCTDHIEL